MLQNIIAKKNLPFRLNAQETPGYNYNLMYMVKHPDKWKNTVFSTENGVLAIAAHGGEPLVKPFFPVKIDHKWKILYNEGSCTAGQSFVTFNPKIKSIMDLKGKRIGLGLRKQSCWGLKAALNLETGAGITPRNSQIFYLGPMKAANELVNGKIDAAINGFIVNYNNKVYNLSGVLRVLAATGRKIYYVSMTKSVIERMNHKYDCGWRIFECPAGTMPDQTKPVLMAADRVYNVVDKSFPHQMAYELVKAVATYGPTLKSSHSYWKVVSHLDMVNGLTTANTDPGAIRAYKELGIWKYRKQFKPATAPAFQ